MPTRVFLFIGVLAVATVVCYLQRYRPPQRQARFRQRKLGVAFNDSGCQTELEEHSSRRTCPVPNLTPDEIRAAFGNN